MKRFFNSLFLLLVVAVVSIPAGAQVTTSSVWGYVQEAANPTEPVIGANISAIHIPSGTRYGSVTNVKGRYQIQGMRTGGPYTIEVSYIGFQTQVFKNVYLKLGEDFQKDFLLKESSEALSEVVVTGTAKAKHGGATQFSQKKIENTPTVSRSVYDIAKLSPMVSPNSKGGITIAGANNRYNSFQIDGTVSNDVFGLTSSGTNGGQTDANAISMDAIQELQVVVAPFDVRQSGFTGGAINAITKQGTNKFFGSAYTLYTNQDMYGKYNAAKGYKEDKLSQQSTKTYGATFGGPIIKDKLFFFTSIEKKENKHPSTYYPGYNEDYLTEAQAKEVAQIYEGFTGIKESWARKDEEKESLGLLARIDWNINEKHKMAVRYQHGNSFKDRNAPSFSNFYFNHSGQRQKNKTNSFVTELNSRFNEKVYNEARFSASYVRDHREVDYKAPSVMIRDIGKRKMKVFIGTEASSGANYLNQDIYSFEDNLSLYLGDHTVTIGTHNEYYSIKNGFIQNAFGYWEFPGISEFKAGKGDKFRYRYVNKDFDGGNIKYAPDLNAAQFGLYAQDKWNAFKGFTLTYGLRVDVPTLLSDPVENSKFNEYAENKQLGVKVGSMPGAKFLFSPRLGFQWYVDNARKSLIRGGVGVFTGRVPFVWLSNAYTNTGVEYNGTEVRNADTPALSSDWENTLNAYSGSNTNKLDIVTISKDYKYPQVLRANLAFEQRLPGDVKLTLEAVYSKNMNNVYFKNLALEKDKDLYIVPGVEESSLPHYNKKVAEKSGYNSIVNLQNTNKGYAYNFSATLQKDFDFGLGLMASYTFGRSKSVNDGASSIAYSNWKYNYSRDINSENELGFSRFDIPHRVMVQVNYSSPKYWNKWMSTDISLMYNGYSGDRYSLAIKGDVNGAGQRDNTLLYIPTKEQLKMMKFVDSIDRDTKETIRTSEQNRQLFEEWIENDSYAKNHRGQFAERNSNLTGWQNEINLHLAQTIYNSKGQGKFVISFDVVNFANMLNKEWGAHYNTPYNIMPISYNKGGFEYNFNKVVKEDISSRWHAQVGFKLMF